MRGHHMVIDGETLKLSCGFEMQMLDDIFFSLTVEYFLCNYRTFFKSVMEKNYILHSLTIALRI